MPLYCLTQFFNVRKRRNIIKVRLLDSAQTTKVGEKMQASAIINQIKKSEIKDN